MKFAKMWRDQSGTSALEFALTAPVFFLFIFGVIEVGLLSWTQIGLQHGAEMAARCASINSTLCPNSNPGAIISYATTAIDGLEPAGLYLHLQHAGLRKPGERELFVPISRHHSGRPAN